MLNDKERKHRDIVIEVLKNAHYSHSQAVAIATHHVRKLRKDEGNE